MNQHCKAKSCTAAALPSSGLCYLHTEALMGQTTFIDEANTTPKADAPLSIQVGGAHYKNLKIQPIEYIHANNIPFPEGNVIKYVTRWRDKNGIKDLEKAKHYIDLLIELERVK